MDPFVAEIRIFGFNFPPRGWAFCDGQLMSISQNTALFSLLGTMYGGDGKVTFGLPNMQGNSPMFFGYGQGLTDRYEGETGGEDYVTLLSTEMPMHNHTLRAAVDNGDNVVPAPQTSLAASLGGNAYTAGGSPQMMSPGGLGPLIGTGGPHNNLQPYLTLNFCIALQGVYPPRG